MEFKRIEEKINDLEWNDRNDLLTENGKELLTELKQALALLSVGKSVKEKHTPTFNEYLQTDFVRIKPNQYKCIYTKIVYSRDSAFKKWKNETNQP